MTFDNLDLDPIERGARNLFVSEGLAGNVLLADFMFAAPEWTKGEAGAIARETAASILYGPFGNFVPANTNTNTNGDGGSAFVSDKEPPVSPNFDEGHLNGYVKALEEAITHIEDYRGQFGATVDSFIEQLVVDVQARIDVVTGDDEEEQLDLPFDQDNIGLALLAALLGGNVKFVTLEQASR